MDRILANSVAAQRVEVPAPVAPRPTQAYAPASQVMVVVGRKSRLLEFALEQVQEARRLADEAGVPVTLRYAVSGDVADTILDLAVTHSANILVLGATRRGSLWSLMQGDVISQVAQYLPARTTLLIHA